MDYFDTVFAYITLKSGAVLLLALIVFGYYYKFKDYFVNYEGYYDSNKRKMSKSLPAFTNGWFIIGRSRNLKSGEVINIDKWGENIALFRGEDNKLYALEAYCAHMGANIAIEGKVKHENCLQCPFHGWTYSGQTGQCVDHTKKPIKGMTYQYSGNIGQIGGKVQWTKCQDQQIKLKTYPLRQLNGYIYIWIHSLPQFSNNPQYEPLDTTWINSFMSERGTARNVIKCHAQDIAENGADIMHFYYVHKYISKFIKFIEMIWVAVWKRGDDPDIEEAFAHPKKHVHQWRQNLYARYLKGNKQLAKNVGVLNFDAYVKLPYFGNIYFISTTAIQLGPGIVYIFVKSFFFSILYLQYMHTNSKYHQQLYHQTYTSSFLPYWMSALLAKIQAMQVYNDTLIWDAKTFKTKMTYRQNPADDSMRKWRQWYGQFYEGCKQKEKAKLSQEW